ncbi:MAG: MerR family transcriptional regulator [Akkermansiaceae bacterium]|nr:MerR family transcriptional regulator [Akkermansiaceae bacterium]MCP5544892.1 MerR family transcriptional regulator [Akkermansiaceae bacterium]MCP5548997.1 MerR family transcriptional regulator [Akkermansiaceae bacterium]
MNDPLPIHDPGDGGTYSLEVAARITGLSSETIVHYQEGGLLGPSRTDAPIDDESLRTLRRIGHLRDAVGVNEPGIRLILELARELETLRDQMRAGF